VFIECILLKLNKIKILDFAGRSRGVLGRIRALRTATKGSIKSNYTKGKSGQIIA
jgi:hypothetical protein